MRQAVIEDTPELGIATKFLVGVIALCLLVLIAEICLLKRSHSTNDVQSRVNNPAYWRTLTI